MSKKSPEAHDVLLTSLRADIERIAHHAQASLTAPPEEPEPPEGAAVSGGHQLVLEGVESSAGPWGEAVLADVRALRDRVQELDALLSGLRTRDGVLTDVTEKVADTFFLVDGEGRILEASERACRLLGFTRDELAALHVWDVAPGLHRDRVAELWRELAHDGAARELDTLHARKDGSTFDVRIRACVTDRGGQPALLVQAWDISEQLRTRRRDELLADIVEGTPDIVGISDAQGRVVFVNGACRRMIGVADGEDVTLRTIAEFHPTWAARVVSEQGIPTAIEKGIWVGETAFRTVDGREVPTSQVLIAHRDAHGGLEYVSTIARDISELKTSEERHRALARAIPDTLFRMSADGTFLDFKGDDENAFAAHPEEIVGSHISQLPLPPHVGRRALELLGEAVATGLPQEFHYEVDLPDGTQHFECRIVKSGDDEGLAIVRDVTARMRAEAIIAENLRKLKSISQQDPLTGLLNSQAIRKKIDWTLAGARRTDRSGALLYLDLDDFKQVNDDLGHEAGDQLLKEIAGRIRGCLRATDLVGRLGGDEFAIVLKEGKDDQETEAVADKLLSTIATQAQADGARVSITASIGIVRFPADGIDATDLLRLADRAMYRAKGSGGNRFVFHAGPVAAEPA